MARRDTDIPPDTARLVQENRAKGLREPAAAPETTDAEAGAHAAPPAVPLTSRTEPVRSHAVNASSDPGDVRAGPGDAGAADSPDRATRPTGGRNTGWGRALFVIGIVVLIALAMVIFGAV